MKYSRLMHLFFFLGSTLLFSEECTSPLLIIKRDNYGLYSGVFAVINSIEWCEKNNHIPVVYWGSNSLYYEKEGYNCCKDNVWEYYFEPISQFNYKCCGSAHPICLWDEYEAPDGLRIPPPFAKDYDRNLDPEYRHKIHTILTKYIKIKQPIVEKAEQFYNRHIAGKKTIGLHLRGTDKHLEVKYSSTLEEICDTANTIALKYPGCQFLVATDEERLLQEARNFLNGPVIAYDAFRSLSGEPIHDSDDHSYNRAKMGEEVIIETLLLSKCDQFVHTRSNVSTAVLFLNPKLPNKVVY